MTKSFKELKDHWYKKIKKSGFKDLEDTSNPYQPLKSWHNLKFKKQSPFNSSEKYYKLASEFQHNPSFNDACKFIIKHGNCKFTKNQIILIWQLHVDGSTRRKIAKELNRSKGRIDSIIWKLQAWMKLI